MQSQDVTPSLIRLDYIIITIQLKYFSNQVYNRLEVLVETRPQ